MAIKFTVYLREGALSNLTGPSWGPASKGVPKQLVILCHGVGSDGNDLISLAPYLGNVLPDAVFVSPNGPEPYDMAPMGRQWFSLIDRSPAKLAAGARRASPVLNEFIDQQLEKFALPPTAYALIGFSQGAMMVLFTGLRRPEAPRAILALSGALVDPDTLQAEMKNHAPVLLGHGGADQVVPAFLSRDAEAALKAASVPVQTILSPQLGHSIDDVILGAGIAFLQKAFGA